MICTPLEPKTERAQTVHRGSGTNLTQVFSFSSCYNLQSGVWSQLWLIRHPSLKAQVNVVCNNIDMPQADSQDLMHILW